MGVTHDSSESDPRRCSSCPIRSPHLSFGAELTIDERKRDAFFELNMRFVCHSFQDEVFDAHFLAILTLTWKAPGTGSLETTIRYSGQPWGSLRRRSGEYDSREFCNRCFRGSVP